MPAGIKVPAGTIVSAAGTFSLPTQGLGVYGPLRPDNNEPLVTADDAASWISSDGDAGTQLQSLNFLGGDRVEWTANDGKSALHAFVFQFDSPADATTMLQDYVAADCSLFSAMGPVPGTTNGISFIESNGETTGRAMVVIGSDLVSVTTCGCQAQMQSAAAGWAQAINATYSVSGKL